MQSNIQLLSILVGAALFGCLPAQASASYSMQMVTTTVNQGDMGDALEVMVTNSGPSSFTVGGFFFEITVADSDVSFTDGNTSTVLDTYIFAGDSFFGPDLTPGFTPAQTIDVGDLSFSGAGAVVAPGATFSLGEVLFNISPTAASGPVTVSFSGGTSANSLADLSGNAISIGSFTGTGFTILGTSSVPEPSTWLPLLAGIGAIVSFARLRRIA